jgi:eukaryotic-like serine/threonine-protein kinase
MRELEPRAGEEHAGSLQPSGLFDQDHEGSQKWVFTTGAYVYSSPAIGADGTIYVSSAKLYAINPDGTQRWAFPKAGYSSPAIGADGTIYVGSVDRNLYAIRSAHTSGR